MNLIGEIVEIDPIEQFGEFLVRGLIITVRSSYVATDGQLKTRPERIFVKLLRDMATSFNRKVGDILYLQVQSDVRRFRTSRGEQRTGFEFRVESMVYLGTNSNPGSEMSVKYAHYAEAQMPESIDINGEAGYTRHLL